MRAKGKRKPKGRDGLGRSRPRSDGSARAKKRRSPAAPQATQGEFLLEVRVEELPPRLLQRAIRQLAGRLFEELMGVGLGPTEVVTGATRRRLMVCTRGLPSRSPDREEQVLGPTAAEAYDGEGAATVALTGFIERLGITLDDVGEVLTERGAYMGLVRAVPGQDVAEVLPVLVPRVLNEIVPAERMTWTTNQDPWLRPVRSLIALLDGVVLPVRFRGIEAGRITTGHPTLSPGEFTIDHFEDYEQQLLDRGIVVRRVEREQRLVDALDHLVQDANATAPTEVTVLQRWVDTCEIPGLVTGVVADEALTAIPDEIVIAVLAHDPGALVLRDDEGVLGSRFVTVMDRADDPSGRVRAGYERVVAGRLADAVFHLDADRQVPLAQRARLLGVQAMCPGHGTWAEHAKRVDALAAGLAERHGLLGDLDRDTLTDAATLLNADRATSMVDSLPALQGVIGGLYARDEGYAEPVWQALYDQHQPDAEDDPAPRGLVGLLIAIAARVDRLVAALGTAPLASATKDRHGLRAVAHGLVRLLMDARLTFDVDLVLARAVLLHGDRLERGHDITVADSRALIMERARLVLGQRGFAIDEIEAAMAIRHDDLQDLEQRVAALAAVRHELYFRALVLATKRIVNMLRNRDENSLDPALLTEPAERVLYDTLIEVRATVDAAVADRAYGEALAAMAALTEPLDQFFADVLILDEDRNRQANRLALLEWVRRVYWRVAGLKEMTIE